jgi:hypothetical protein
VQRRVHLETHTPLSGQRSRRRASPLRDQTCVALVVVIVLLLLLLLARLILPYNPVYIPIFVLLVFGPKLQDKVFVVLLHRQFGVDMSRN